MEIPRASTIVVVLTLAVATWRLAVAGQGWADVGLRAPAHWWQIPLGVVLIYAAVAAGNIFLILPLARELNWASLALERLGDLRGDRMVLLGMIGVAWTTAAFGEEMLFRGFLLSRIEGALGGGGVALTAAIVGQAVLFGVAHAYLGMRGAVTAAFVGLVFGVAYIAFGRNLWPLIVAHGVIDSASLIAIHLGAAGGSP